MASKGAGAHRKGSNEERRVAKILTKWSGQRVMRTLSSGAGGTRAVDEIRMTGDLFFPLGSDNPFSYEVKDHATTKLQHVFNNNGDIPEFWEQAVTDCRRVKKFGYTPMLIFHVTRQSSYVLTPYKKELASMLFKRRLTCSLQQTSFHNERTGTTEIYFTILTKLDDLIQLDYRVIFEVYKDFDWEQYMITLNANKSLIDVFEGIDELLTSNAKTEKDINNGIKR